MSDLRLRSVRPKPGFVFDGEAVIPARLTRDGLANIMTGRGTSVDRNAHRFWHHVQMTDEQIEAAYRSSWLISKIVDLPVMDMVREWREWEGEPEVIARIEAEERRLKAVETIMTGLAYGRLGGGVVIIGSGTDMSAPARAGEKVLYLKALPKRYITLGEMDWDVLSEGFGEPAWFTINGSGGQDRVHPSRVIPFKGERVPGIATLTGEEWYWGDSIVERVDGAVKNADAAADGFASLIDEAKIDIFRFAKMYETLGQPGGEAKITDRVNLATVGKSVHRSTILDAEDEWEQRQINWPGMPDVIKTYMSIVAGAADIPATRLLGKAPDGQNATGESDEKNYRSSIRTRQGMVLRPALDKLDAIMLPSLGMAMDMPWTFSPIDAPTEAEAADIAYKKAQMVNLYANSGTVPMDALDKGVQSMLIEDGTFPGLKEALEELPDVPQGNHGDPDPSAIVSLEGGDPSLAGAGASNGSGAPRRAQDAFFADSAPRPLYVQRKLLNAAPLIAWAKENGFKSTLPAEDMHVTVLYSKTAVDPMKMGESWSGDENGHVRVKPGGPRAIERLGPSAVVLLFSSWEIEGRHRSMVDAGGSHDFGSYQPHVTLSYEVPEGVDLEAIKPYTGALEFGEELFEPLDLDWKRKVAEE